MKSEGYVDRILQLLYYKHPDCNRFYERWREFELRSKIQFPDDHIRLASELGNSKIFGRLILFIPETDADLSFPSVRQERTNSYRLMASGLPAEKLRFFDGRDGLFPAMSTGTRSTVFYNIKNYQIVNSLIATDFFQYQKLRFKSIDELIWKWINGEKFFKVDGRTLWDDPPLKPYKMNSLSRKMRT